MGKKLAIKGHATRGNEVIELLEMMGGSNPFSNNGGVAGNRVNSYYYTFETVITKYISWDYIDSENSGKYKIFTLEEFLKKFPFKVGDVIRFPYNDMVEEIAEMEWDEELEDIIYTSVSGTKRPCSVPKNTNNETNVKTDCKKCCIHGSVSNPLESKSYTVNLKDSEVIDNSIDASQFMQFGKIAAVCFNTENYENEVELKLGDYEIEVRDGKTYAVKKKPKYPKTYTECCEVFGLNHYLGISWNSYDEYSGVIPCLPKQIDDIGKKLESLSKLLICRNAYWKIAGEEMGLGKSWEPDWNDEKQDKYGFHNEVRYTIINSATFVFPTEEMRDAFYENFKTEIENCKELL